MPINVMLKAMAVRANHDRYRSTVSIQLARGLRCNPVLALLLAGIACTSSKGEEPSAVQVAHLTESDGPQVGGAMYIQDADGVSKPLGGDAVVTAEVQNAFGEWVPATVTVNSGPVKVDTMLVADNSGSERNRGKSIRRAAHGFVEGLLISPEHRVGLVRVSTVATLRGDLTNDAAQASAHVEDLFISNGWTALYDGIRLANETLVAGVGTNVSKPNCMERGLRSIVVFSDGGDNNSADEHPTDAAGDGIATTLDDLLKLEVDGARTPIFTVGVGKDVDAAALTQLSHESGGDYVSIADYDNLLSALNEKAAKVSKAAEFCIERTSCDPTQARITVTEATSSGPRQTSTEFSLPMQSCNEYKECVRQNDCVVSEISLKRTQPTIMVLVDQSASMSKLLEGNRTRWAALRDSLIDPKVGLMATLQSDVRFGLGLYSNNRSVASTCPLLSTVDFELDNYARIAEMYSKAKPIGDTPTAESLDQVVALLDADAASGPKAVILATDGEPDRCAAPDAHDEISRQMSLEAARKAYQKGISVYVISVGNEVGEKHLSDLANAGAGLEGGGAEQAPFYRANDTSSLTHALSDIVTGVRSCVFTLDGSVAADEEDLGVVTVDGVKISHEGSDGWRLNSPTELQLLGASCDSIKKGNHDVRASFPCPCTFK
ncbi:MAG: VWA domain-containing protein [Polyangiaceae bacterium]|nr:VWA domain-containing protein [Polyangiaceae bacterium]